MFKKTSYAVCVKLKPEQYFILKEVSQIIDRSIPDILRRSFFGGIDSIKKYLKKSQRKHS